MTKKYDLVIVGAGPGGAMAAKTAGENGLKTALLERKTNPAKITRGCAMMFELRAVITLQKGCTTINRIRK